MKIGKEIKRVKSPARRIRKYDHPKWKVLPWAVPTRKKSVGPMITTET